MPNPYVNWWSDTNEQSLIQDLMTEAIQFYAFQVYYLPRTMRREDTLYNEDVLSQFTDHYHVDMYIKNVAGWEGQGNFLSKFGLQIDHNVTMMVSVDTFNSIVPLSRPTEGDWIYFPAPIDKMFEIKFVENQKGQGQFYPLGKITFYELQLELYTYSHEGVRTTLPEIDAFEQTKAYAQDLYMETGSNGYGEYQIGETVYQGTSLEAATAKGVVAGWEDGAHRHILRLTDIAGTFAINVEVYGVTSGAYYHTSQPPEVLAAPNNPTADNQYLDNLDTSIVDILEGNPFKGL